MPRDSVKNLLSTLAIDNPEEWKEKWLYDCFAAVRPIFEMFDNKTSKYLLPSLYLTTEETLYPMSHQIAFQQYYPGKSHKYELLLN